MCVVVLDIHVLVVFGDVISAIFVDFISNENEFNVLFIIRTIVRNPSGTKCFTLMGLSWSAT